MDNEREIEKVITEHLELKPMADLGCDGLYLSIPGVKALSQAILDYLKKEGWVRKEDVGLNEYDFIDIFRSPENIGLMVEWLLDNNYKFNGKELVREER